MQNFLFVIAVISALAIYLWRSKNPARNIPYHAFYEQELLKRTKLEEQLSGFAASAPGFFYSYRHDPDGKHSMPFASDGIHELFGLHPKDVANNIEPLSQLTHPDDVTKLHDAIERSRADLALLDIEFRIAHPVKDTLWIESRATPVLNQDGSTVWHGFMHDITQRKHMEDVLRYSRENFAEAQRIGKMGSWEQDSASGILTCSDEIYRILERDPSRVPVFHETFLNAIHPEDREAVAKTYAASLEKDASYSIDYRLLFPDSRIKLVRECIETHREAVKESHHSHGTVQDITSLKVTEQRLKDTQDKFRELVISRELLREDERKRVAWEMHEELGQLLAAMKMRMSGLRSKLQKSDSSQADDSRAVIELIDSSISTVHDIVSELRPTVLFHGVVAALEWLAAEFNKHPGLECELNVNEEEDIFVSDEMTTLVFRIAQEVLENTMRHANVTHVIVSWTSNKNSHCLAVQHDGVSQFTELSSGKSLSFFGMQERIAAYGGEMQVFSTLDHGTVIEASFQNK